MRKYIITEEQLKILSNYQNLSENIDNNFDSNKVKIVNGILYYNNIAYKIFTAGKERFFKNFSFDGKNLKMEFKDGKPQEFSTDNWIWGGKIKEIINGLVRGSKEISVAAGQLMLKKIN